MAMLDSANGKVRSRAALIHDLTDAIVFSAEVLNKYENLKRLVENYLAL
jgi:hypothetical protein